MHEITTHLFTLPIPLLEKIVRPIIVYVFLVLLLRVFGKRELAQLNPFDLVVLLSLSNTVQNAIIGDDNSITGGLIGAVSVLVMNCVVDNNELAKELISTAELLVIARRQGFDNLDDLDEIVLEPGGAF